MFPFLSPTTLGNDYLVYSPQAQIELMWSVWNGTFPLYMPGFAGGHSTAAMTLGQLYHPISWISSLVPGYWRGHAADCNTLFRLLSLGVAHLALFKLCRRLRVAPLPAFFLTFPVVYNLRMLDSFRYAASLDGYVGMLLMGATGGLVFLDHRKKAPVALLAFSTYLVAVNGHPQWAFLALLIAGLFTLLFPWAARAIDPGLPRLERRWFWCFVKRISVGFGSGLLIASPYLLTFYFEYFKTNHSRAENDYAWTLGFSDSFRGEVSNFMFPLHSDVHGAFAGSAFFLVAALFPLAALVKKPPRILWVYYGIGALAFSYALGKETWVHHFMVTRLPLFGSFRVPGRLVLWIPLTTLPVVGWMLRPDLRRALFAAAAGALVLLAMNWLWTTNTLPAAEYASPRKILGKHLPGYMDSLVLTLSLATALTLTAAAKYRRAFRPLLALSGGFMIATTCLCLGNGTWRQKTTPMRTFDQIADARKASVASRADPGDGMEMRTVTEYHAHKLKLDQKLGTVVHQVEQVGSESEILKRLQAKGARLPLFIDRPVAPLAPASTPDRDKVKLVYNTSNRFVFDVVAAKDGYFVLGVPRLPGFRGAVDGTATDIAVANALYPAVFLSRGAHRVEFRFISTPFFAGVTLCFLTVWAWIFAWSRRRWLVAIAGLVSAGALGGLLYLSLFHGPSFGTVYQWQGPIDAQASASSADRQAG